MPIVTAYAESMTWCVVLMAVFLCREPDEFCIEFLQWSRIGQSEPWKSSSLLAHMVTAFFL